MSKKKSRNKSKLNRPRHRARLLGPSGVCPCYYCGRPVDENTITLDHLVPRYQGGTNEDKNIVAACHPCNCAKGQGSKVSEYKRAQIENKFPVVRLSNEITRLKRVIVGLRVYSNLYKKVCHANCTRYL